MGGVVRSLTILSFDCEFARLATSLVMSHFSKSYHLKDRMESHGQFVNFVQLKKKSSNARDERAAQEGQIGWEKLGEEGEKKSLRSTLGDADNCCSKSGSTQSLVGLSISLAVQIPARKNQKISLPVHTGE